MHARKKILLYIIPDHSYEIVTSNSEEEKNPSFNLTPFGPFSFLSIVYATTALVKSKDE